MRVCRTDELGYLQTVDHFVNDFVNFVNFLPLSWGNLRPSFADTFVDRANATVFVNRFVNMLPKPLGDEIVKMSKFLTGFCSEIV